MINNISENEKTILRLINKQLIEYAKPQISTPCKFIIPNNQWKNIHSLLLQQTVLFFPADILLRSIECEKQKKAYVLEIAKNCAQFHRIMWEQAKVINILSNAGIDLVIIKGAASAMYYPKPSFRQMGDIDIIVPPNQFNQAFMLLKENGYCCAKSPDDITRHAEFFSETCIEIELHKKYSSGEDNIQNDVLDQMIFNGITESKIVKVDNYFVPVLPKLENGIILLNHIKQHLYDGLGLRQVIDWHMYVQNNLDDLFWYTTFSNKANVIGQKKLAETITLLCKKYFGLPSQITWCDEADEKLADELMLYILSKGNFGHNCDATSTKNISIIRKLLNPISAFKYLTAGGLCHWKMAQKYSYLKCFAWIYQLIYLTKVCIKQNRKLSDYLFDLKESKYEKSLLNRLDLSE